MNDDCREKLLLLCDASGEHPPDEGTLRTFVDRLREQFPREAAVLKLGIEEGVIDRLRTGAARREAASRLAEQCLMAQEDAQWAVGTLAEVGGVADNGHGKTNPGPHDSSDSENADPDIGPQDIGLAVGIDLGTTFSVVAYVDDGVTRTIHSASGDLTTPSVVFLDDTGPLVGKEAVKAGLVEPDKVAECVKRDMGKEHYHRPVGGKQYPPEVLSSMILSALKADVKRKLGDVDRAVITVPAYFDEPRRKITVDAGRLAGWDVLDIINEPTAAAIAYGFDQGFLNADGRIEGEKPLRVLVYDLGGGTFDVTIVEIGSGSFKAIATDGDVRLGGKDWDERIVNLLAERFQAEHGADPRDDAESRQELHAAAEEAKRSLTEREKANVSIAHDGDKLRMVVTRDEFERATAALLRRTKATTEIVVRQAGLQWEDIGRVLLVGGSTRMPQVVRMLTELTGKEPDRRISADESVAHGAALYANLLLCRKRLTLDSDFRPPASANFQVTNVNSHSLGIVGIDPKRKRRVNRVLIPKNTALPAEASGVFKTYKAGQTSVKIQILEGENEQPEANTRVGSCVIRNLPPTLPEGWPVQVTYRYGENGQLEVIGRVKGYEAGIETTFVRDSGLPEGDLLLWAEYVRNAMSGAV